MSDLHQDIVHFVRLVVEGKGGDASAVGRRLLRQVAKDRPALAPTAGPLVAQLSGSVVRRAFSGTQEATPVPVDADSRLELVRRYEPSTHAVPAWPDQVQRLLDRLVDERQRAADLLAAGVTPTKSALFVGPPGVGKTLAAHAIASRIGRELLVLDLAAVMSSFLGRTGNNLRVVIDFAARGDGVLLLDEFDAIAKRRDDASDVGELKRLVNVLLQSIDEWPSHGLLIAATNHPELLDPAVWRRFDTIVSFPKPDGAAVRDLIRRLITEAAAEVVDFVATTLDGSSYADITRDIQNARRDSILRNVPLQDALLALLADRLRELPRAQRIDIANALLTSGHSQRRVHDVTGLSRDTIKKHRARGEIEGHGA